MSKTIKMNSKRDQQKKAVSNMKDYRKQVKNDRIKRQMKRSAGQFEMEEVSN